MLFSRPGMQGEREEGHRLGDYGFSALENQALTLYPIPLACRASPGEREDDHRLAHAVVALLREGPGWEHLLAGFQWFLPAEEHDWFKDLIGCGLLDMGPL